MNIQDYKIRYKDWAPSAFDIKGLYGEELGISDWFVVPIMVTRYSDSRANSKFKSVKTKLGKADHKQEDWNAHRFGHWGPGWIEIIVVKPGTKAEKVLNKIISDAVA